jgi:hypothetical protein
MTKYVQELVYIWVCFLVIKRAFQKILIETQFIKKFLQNNWLLKIDFKINFFQILWCSNVTMHFPPHPLAICLLREFKQGSLAEGEGSVQLTSWN